MVFKARASVFSATILEGQLVEGGRGGGLEPCQCVNVPLQRSVLSSLSWSPGIMGWWSGAPCPYQEVLPWGFWLFVFSIRVGSSQSESQANLHSSTKACIWQLVPSWNGNILINYLSRTFWLGLEIRGIYSPAERPRQREAHSSGEGKSTKARRKKGEWGWATLRDGAPGLLACFCPILGLPSQEARWAHGGTRYFEGPTKMFLFLYKSIEKNELLGWGTYFNM